MQGEIKTIREVMLEPEFKILYEITIWMEEMPNLKLGKCEVKQSDKI